MATNFSLNEYLTIDTTGSVGIGTNVPLSRLYVTGSSSSTTPTMVVKEGVNSASGVGVLDVQNSAGTSLFFVSGSGNIGVGTNRLIDSRLNVYTESANGTNGLRVFGGAVTNNVRIRPAMTAGAINPIVQEGDSGIIFDGETKDTGNFVIAPWATGISGLRMTAAGDVGIGISTPSAKLDVNGTVLATSLSGSLTRLSDGTSYLVAGSGVSLVTSSNGSVTISSTASGGGDSAASYLVLSATGSLTSERVFTSGTGITTTDGGAGGNYTIGINDSVVATVSGTTFTGVTKHSAGLSGSLTNLTDGTSYLIGGSNISVTTGSNGSVSLATTGLAPLASPYLIVGSDATLTNERSIAAGTGLSSTDAGAGGNYTLSINNSVVATVSGTTFTGATKHSAGLSGSLTNLTDGTSYLVAGSNVTITTGSNGAVTIASSSPPGTVTGTGTTNYLSKFTGTSTVGNSALTESSSVVNITSTSNNAELRLNNSFSRVAFIDGGGGWAGGYNIKGDASPFSSIRHDSTGNAAGVWYSSLGILFYANASQVGGSSPAEVMRIASAGKVGIGTTGSSTARLQVQGTSTGSDTTLLVKHNVADGSNLPVLDVQNSAGTSLLFVSGSGFVGLGTSATNSTDGLTSYEVLLADTKFLSLRESLANKSIGIRFAANGGATASSWTTNTSTGEVKLFGTTNFFWTLYTNNSEKLRIDTSGNVGIGTTLLDSKLVVNGNSVFSGSANPDGDNTRSLGSSTKRWSNIYATSVSGSLTGSNVSAGQVVVAGTGGVVSGSNSFWWDNTNARVGIGNTAPQFQLTVNGTVGLSSNLVKTTALGAGGTVLDVDTSAFSGDRVPFSITGHASQAYNLFQIGVGGAGNRFVVNSSGNVAIGTSSFTGRLFVSGSSTGTVTTLLARHGVADGSNLPVLDVQNSAGTSLLFVSGSGGVGINTNNPSVANLYVSSSLTGNAASALIIGGQVGLTSVNTYKGQIQLFQLANGTTEVMRLNSAANVGIGTGTYTARLFVSGSSTAATPTMIVREGAITPLGVATFDVQNSAGTSLLFVSGSGNIGIGRTTTLDSRFNVYTTNANGSDGLRVFGGATLSNVRIRPAMSAGANNSIVAEGDSGIIFDGGSVDTGAFVIAPWATGTSGLRMTAAGNIGIGTATNLSTLTVNGGFAAKAPSTVNAATYTVAATDYSLRFTTTNCTVTLPAAASFPGRILILNTITANSATSATSNVIPLGSDTAAAPILAATAGKFAMIQSNGTNWVTLTSN